MRSEFNTNSPSVTNMAGVYETLTVEQKLRLSLQKDVKEILIEASKILDLEVGESTSELIAEFAWRKLTVYATDLEQFAKHAKRSTINAEDIKLLVRRNPSLKSYVTSLAENISSNSGAKEKKKRGSSAAASTSSAIPFTAQSKSKANEESTKTSAKNKSKEDNADEPTIDLT